MTINKKQYLKQSWINSKVEEKNSPSHGRGLFAKDSIKAGEVVVIWGGDFMNEADAKKAKQAGKAIQQINKNLWDVFDYETRNDDPSYNHNHSCDPNTWMQDDVTITARCDISPGEELTIDYAMLVIDDQWVMPNCKCGSALCRHTITGLDWQKEDLQERYASHFSPFISERIKKQKGKLRQSITFITGNQHKANYLAHYLGFPVEHVKLDLDEIQSLDLKKIVEHKIQQAYQKIKRPVIVEDVSLEFSALGGLPGPFIRFFVEKTSFKTMCSLVNGKSRRAVARCVFGYYDGKIIKLFEGKLEGTIAKHPRGKSGFGWDRIFVPDGYKVTRACLNEEEDRRTYLKLKPFYKLKKFLKTIYAPR